MEKLPSYINETAIRNERILGYWMAIDQNPDLDYTYTEKVQAVSEKFHIGYNTARNIINLLKKEYPEDMGHE